jgi:glucose-1-phosphate adenylyltransferase
MSSKKILALVLAGGRGTRLHPLTAEHAKPALPFAGGYRIVDFVLSNLVNSGITRIYVLAQYKPQSLMDHLRSAWCFAPDGSGRRINVVLPRAASEPAGCRGTADAVYQNLHLLEEHDPDVVAVFAADHVYRMDVRQMAEFHHNDAADVTVGAVAVPLANASSFGVMGTGADGRVSAFQEKPQRPRSIPSDPARAYASMGNYLFKPELLAAALSDCSRCGDTDFGAHLLPRLVRTHRVVAYDFARNRIPGVQPWEEPGYWRDVGTLEAYRRAQRDVVGPTPRFSLWNPAWPLRGAGRGWPAEGYGERRIGTADPAADEVSCVDVS